MRHLLFCITGLSLCCNSITPAFTEESFADYCSTYPSAMSCQLPEVVASQHGISLSQGGIIGFTPSRGIIFREYLSIRITQGNTVFDTPLIKEADRLFQLTLTPAQLQSFKQGTAELFVIFHSFDGTSTTVADIANFSMN